MVDHVVSTKLSEEDLANLLEACKRHQCTTSKLVKLAITKWIESENTKIEDQPLQLKAIPSSPKSEEKVIVRTRRVTSIDEAYFQYFRDRIDISKYVESR